MQAFFKKRAPHVVERQVPIFLLYAALFYNAFLAALNAHGVKIDNGIVLVTEGAILAVGCAYILTRLRFVKGQMSLVVLSFFIYTMLFAWTSITNASFSVKSLGDFVIIFMFTLLGTQCTSAQLIRAFRFITLAVVGVMLIEGLFVDFYVSLFQPASYYAGTRGVEELSVDSSGLFRNSLGFEGRFSYGLFGMRRLSSLFLEQVSLANFSMVLSIFTMSFWQKIKGWDRLLFIASIIFILLSTSSRTSTILCLIMVFGYFIFPRLPRYSFRLTMPLVLLSSFLFFYNPNAGMGIPSDDIQGRIEHTTTMLAAVNGQDFLTGNTDETTKTMDAGYTYLIYSQTLFGLIYFWFFLAKILPAQKNDEKRFSQGTSLYIACNLLVGAAIFSIKVSAPLWLIAGYLASQSALKKAAQITHE